MQNSSISKSKLNIRIVSKSNENLTIVPKSSITKCNIKTKYKKYKLIQGNWVKKNVIYFIIYIQKYVRGYLIRNTMKFINNHIHYLR